MPSATVLGYYRFTDIFFEWHQALPVQEDISPLKAFISYDALVNPEHPLRKEGVDGIELFIGTFENGEARLLFSSAQIEYIRYWLKATDLTKELIPLPARDYMITQSSMMSCSPSIYKSAAVLKKAIRTIDKNNKRLKGLKGEPLLSARRLSFEKIRTFWASKKGTFLAMDFETWDRDHTMFLEFGWSIIKWDDGKEVNEDGHLIVDKYKFYRNTYVPDYKDRYSFGKSEYVSMKEFKERINDLISTHQALGPLFLVFHDASQDIISLRTKDIDAPLLNLMYLLPDTAPAEGLFVVDTAEMFAALEGSSSVEKRGLQQMCRHLQIPSEFLHNAGNDAHFTMAAMKAMASGDPVDVQREKRWPNNIVSNEPKVAFKPSDEDSDLTDGDDDPIHVGEVMVDPSVAHTPYKPEDNLWAGF